MDKKDEEKRLDRKSVMLDIKTHKILKDRAENNGRTIKGEIKWILGVNRKISVENETAGDVP